MEIQTVLTAFAALSQESRLKVFRLLVQRGAEGLAAGTIASQLGITPATMSHHLEQLSQAGLLSSRREGRSIIYSANYDTMQNLINFLLENCCAGKDKNDEKSDCCTEITTCSEFSTGSELSTCSELSTFSEPAAAPETVRQKT